jgi:GNAT superfamily N-acetyltransferase
MEASKEAIELTGYYPGVSGKIIQLHATYYHVHWGLDITFETQVARELSDFLARFDPAQDGFWVARRNHRFAGSVSIDAEQSGREGVRLRWFIVDPEFQNFGVGATLIDRAIEFCRRAHHRKIFLWTFQGLDAARRLYERRGFRLIAEHSVNQWGTWVNEQKFELDLDKNIR